MFLLLACSDRPDDVDASFESIDGPDGLVRVHFTREGADAVDPTDEDADGLPDRAETSASVAEGAIRYYQVAGYPLPLGDEGGGGNDALDLYLAAPQKVRAEGLTRCRWGGGFLGPCFILIPPTGDNLASTVGHEVFHASTAAYGVDPDFWFGESSAVWMASRATSTSQRYRSDWNYWHTCAVAQAEVGSDCLGAVYGLALLWEHFEHTRGPDVLLRSWEILAEGEDDAAGALEAALAEDGTSIEEVWPTVASWNLATGDLASDAAPLTEAYESAAAIHAPEMDATGETLRLTATIEPWSIRYYLVHHPGGHVWMGVGGDGRHLRVSVHSAEGVVDAYPVNTSAPSYGLPADGDLDLGHHEKGPVYLVVSNPEPSGIVTPLQLCVDSQPCDPGCGNLSLAWIGVGLVRIRGLRRRARPRPMRRRAPSTPGR